jgi:hypothetical protein
VDELEQLLRAVLGFSRERSPPLLGDDAGVAKLPDVLDYRQSAHHVLLAEFVQHVEVEVAEELMPAPRFIILTRGQAERPSSLEVEDVEAIGAAPDLDQKLAALILDPQHALVDLHL